MRPRDKASVWNTLLGSRTLPRDGEYSRNYDQGDETGQVKSNRQGKEQILVLLGDEVWATVVPRDTSHNVYHWHL